MTLSSLFSYTAKILNRCMIYLLLLLLCTPSCFAQKQSLLIAVAADFVPTLYKITTKFTHNTGIKILISEGATGKLYQQIVNGAPYDIFLAADARYPQLLEKAHKAVSGWCITYAIGHLVLWAPGKNIATNPKRLLQRAEFTHLAIANPKLAPYGRAAQQTLTALNLYKKLYSKLVFGQNIVQTFSYVKTGNAPLGFVAMSQLSQQAQKKNPSVWLVPQYYYHPIKQQAVLLLRAKHNGAAKQFMRFLTDKTIQKIITAQGYSTELPGKNI